MNTTTIKASSSLVTTTRDDTVVLIPCDNSLPIREIHRSETEAAISSCRDAIMDCMNIIPTLLVRDGPMLYAHHDPTTTTNTSSPNIRATRVAMVCGQFRLRLQGTVVLSCKMNHHLTASNVEAATRTVDVRSVSTLPDWLANASRSHFLDLPVLDRFAKVMSEDPPPKDPQESSCCEDDSEDGVEEEEASHRSHEKNTYVATTVPLCLSCRRPTNNLCPDCFGVYFCNAACSTEG